MDTEFVNMYIESLNTEVVDLTKQKIILRAQLTYQEKLAAALKSRVDELEKALDKASKLKKTKEDF